MTRLAPVIALSHGGGPLPILGDPASANLVDSLRTRVPELLRLGTPNAPRAIILITAHWSEDKLSISSGNKHRLYYDYYGFPEESYKLKYDASGSPEIAEEVQKAMAEAGIDAELDNIRGWDHGVFVPMLLVNPSANVPIVQLSVLNSEDPVAHYNIGRALHRLRSQNIAIIGSGFASIHNMRFFRSAAGQSPEFRRRNDDWSHALTAAVEEESVEERGRRLEGWRKFPNAYEMHPRGGAEHFLPLVVCAGAGGEGKAGSYVDKFMGWNIWSYYWE